MLSARGSFCYTTLQIAPPVQVSPGHGVCDARWDESRPYTVTKALPNWERYGLQSQLRRAAVSTATNIVEGCARQTSGEYCQFLSIAHGSAREASYQLTLCARLGYLAESSTTPLANDYDHAAAMLLRIIDGVR